MRIRFRNADRPDLDHHNGDTPRNIARADWADLVRRGVAELSP